MSRRNLLNRAFFDIPAMRPLGRWVYRQRQFRDTKAQSTATKFFRNLEQLSAFDEILTEIISLSSIRILVAGCSMGCEAFSIAGHLALSRPNLNFHIDASDISEEALDVARAGVYGREHGLGRAKTSRVRELEARLFKGRGEIWPVKDDIRARVDFTLKDILASDFSPSGYYDCVFGQNFMIHMSWPEAERAFAALVSAVRPGGALFVGGMDLDLKSKLIAIHNLEPIDWNITDIHNADDMRRSAWPWRYWSLEPIDRRASPFTARYATIFRRPVGCTPAAPSDV